MGSTTNSLRNAKASAALKAAIYLYKDGYLSSDLVSNLKNYTGFNIGAGEEDLNIELSENY